MSEQAPHDTIQRTEWNIGDDFDPSALNAVFDQPAVEADAWAYDDREDNHGYRWEAENDVSIAFFPKTSLLYVSGSNLESPSVLQEAVERDPTNTNAYSINGILTEVNTDTRSVTFTTRDTNNGQRFTIKPNGEVTLLSPIDKVSISGNPSPATAIFHASGIENFTMQSDYEDGGHN